MTEHVPVQDPDDYSDEDMMSFAERLFSPLTPTEELEHICMLLAHIPTEEAQGLLRRFQESARADEVTWLECAADEGAFSLFEPRNDEVLGFDDGLRCLQHDLDETAVRMEAKETLMQYLKRSITTPRYRNADPSVIRHIHLD